MQHALELDAAVADAIASRTLAENVAIIEANQLTAMPVQTVADIERDPHWQAREPHAVRAQWPTARSGCTTSSRGSPRRPAEIQWAGGELGQDNAAVYGELGLDPADLERLRAAASSEPPPMLTSEPWRPRGWRHRCFSTARGSTAPSRSHVFDKFTGGQIGVGRARDPRAGRRARFAARRASFERERLDRQRRYQILHDTAVAGRSASPRVHRADRRRGRLPDRRRRQRSQPRRSRRCCCRPRKGSG